MFREKSRYLGIGLIAGGLLLGSAPLADLFRARPNSSDFRLMFSPDSGVGYYSGRVVILKKIPCNLLPEDLRKPYGLSFEDGRAAVAYPFSVSLKPTDRLARTQVVDTYDCKAQKI